MASKRTVPQMFLLITVVVLKLVYGEAINNTCVPGVLPSSFEHQCPGGYAMRCNEIHLSDVPKNYPKYLNSSKMCLLDLSQNDLTYICNSSFIHATDIVWLYLQVNHISRIDSDAFVNLTNLRYLNISTNHLQYAENFGDGVFKPLINLVYINLKNNSIRRFDHLQAILQPLRNLESLYITGCYNCTFGVGFEQLKRLKNVSLSGTDKNNNNCNISVLVDDTFKHLPQIQNVFVSLCNVKHVEISTFKTIKNIRHLDISYNNDLGFTGVRDVLAGLANSSIDTLNMDHIIPHHWSGMGKKLKYEHMQPIQYLHNLTKLSMSLNKIEVIEKEVLTLIPNSTTFLDISRNRLTYDEYVKKLHNMKHIISLDISYQHMKYEPFFHNHYENTPLMEAETNEKTWLQSNGLTSNIPQGYRFEKMMFDEKANITCESCLFNCFLNKVKCGCVPPKLRYLRWRMSFVYFHIGPFRICPPTSLETLDLSFNLLTSWEGPLYGFEALQKLSLAENFCGNIKPYFFDKFYNLNELNVSYNLLGPFLNPDNINASKYFKNLVNLEKLDLSENRITALSSDLFKNLSSLKYLNLSGNMIGQWDSVLVTKCLRVLDIKGNKLETLPTSFRDYLDSLTKLNEADSCNRTGLVKVVLSGNPIQCNCDTRPFLRWLSSTSVDIHFYIKDECHLQDGRRLQLIHKDIISDIVSYLDKECFPYVSVIVSVCAFLSSLVICFVMYRYRWRLRYWYYSKRVSRYRHRGYDRLFERDAFISYAETESNFIKNSLVPALEDDPRNQTVWVADRDSMAGNSIAVNIAHAIHNCRKTVILLSRSYLKEAWCDFEMNMARMEAIHSHRQVFIIVLYEDIPTQEMPLDFLRLLQSEQSIEYPESPQYYETFWDALSTSIQDE